MKQNFNSRVYSPYGANSIQFINGMNYVIENIIEPPSTLEDGKPQMSAEPVEVTFEDLNETEWSTLAKY